MFGDWDLRGYGDCGDGGDGYVQQREYSGDHFSGAGQLFDGEHGAWRQWSVRVGADGPDRIFRHGAANLHESYREHHLRYCAELGDIERDDDERCDRGEYIL